MVLAVQDSVSVLLVGAWLIWRCCKPKCEREREPSTSLTLRVMIAWAVLVGLASQFLGNLPVIWAMSVVGLAVTITAVLGTGLLAAEFFGRIFLGERVSVRSSAAMTMLFAAIALISFGAQRTNASLTAETAEFGGPLWIGIAIAAACMAGTTYAALGVVVRRLMIGGTPHSLILFIVPAVGVATLGPLSLAQQGSSGVLATRGRDIEIMLVAGVLNLLAYLAAVHGLKLMSLLQNNVLLASQVAMAAVAGFLFFAEPPSFGLVAGVILTIVGMIWLDKPAENKALVSPEAR
jgi:drug/metabolite transporter (DMT)-like permease